MVEAKRSPCIYMVETRKLHDARCADAVSTGAHIGGPRILFKNKKQAIDYLRKNSLKLRKKLCKKPYKICEGVICKKIK